MSVSELVEVAHRDQRKLHNLARALSFNFRQEIAAHATAATTSTIKYKTQWLLENVVRDMESYV